MQMRVKLFAAIRDAAGVDVVVVEANTVAEVAEQLRNRWPAIALLIDRSRFAVNQVFARPETAIGENDEVAVIPPVSGG